MTDMINAYKVRLPAACCLGLGWDSLCHCNSCKPMLLWNDGAGDTPCQRTSQYWDAAKFRSWVYNESPVRDSIVINERCGQGCVGDYTDGPDR